MNTFQIKYKLPFCNGLEMCFMKKTFTANNQYTWILYVQPLETIDFDMHGYVETSIMWHLDTQVCSGFLLF